MHIRGMCFQEVTDWEVLNTSTIQPNVTDLGIYSKNSRWSSSSSKNESSRQLYFFCNSIQIIHLHNKDTFILLGLHILPCISHSS